MSGEVEKFNQLFEKRLNGSAKIQTAYAICKEVDWDAKTMTATGQADGLDYFNVQLGLGSVFQYPKDGSLCLIGLIENHAANAFLIACDSVEKLHLKADNSEVQVNKEGIHVKRGDQDLKSVLNDMITEINKIKVIYGNTINVVEMEAIRNRLNNILI